MTENLMPLTAERTRCIVFIPGGTGLDVQIHQRLSDRGWTVETQAILERAVAEICMLARTQHARSDWGLQASERLVLVMPPALEEDAIVRDALGIFAPEVIVCGIRNGDLDEDSQARLGEPRDARSVGTSDEGRVETPPTPALAPSRRTGAPQLRLTGVMDDNEAEPEPIPPFTSEAETAEDPPDDSSVVSRDELDMLLDSDEPRKEPR